MGGAGLIAEERTRQVEREGWLPEHDDQWEGGELALAAVAYIVADEVDAEAFEQNEFCHTAALSFWPWELRWWKPRDRLSNLVRAGALIAAEIDRLQRLKAKVSTGN